MYGFAPQGRDLVSVVCFENFVGFRGQFHELYIRCFHLFLSSKIRSDIGDRLGEMTSSLIYVSWQSPMDTYTYAFIS